ncbi:unnamed protein product [Parnassius apollo]|uniref:(apollo) hypothetical protein n=1 Tax=Parnassius apollo TaxID=110799 RepID=A0A8S3WJF8_PARAO|nr:unnamed protein product [Parnassius apollo]
MSVENNRVSSVLTAYTGLTRSTISCFMSAIYIKICQRRWISCRNDQPPIEVSNPFGRTTKKMEVLLINSRFIKKK